MAAIVFVSFTVAYLAMGADGAFEPESYEVSRLWLAVWFVGSLAAAIVGGLVCAAVAKGGKPIVALAVLVLVLGAADAAMKLAPRDDLPTTRSGEVGNFEAMMSARMPPWVAVTTPLIGALGVVIGGRLKRASATPVAQPDAPAA
jgi:hypothetical protein